MFKRIRDALTGRFTTQAEAVSRPAETVAEAVRTYQPIEKGLEAYHRTGPGPAVEGALIAIIGIPPTNPNLRRTAARFQAELDRLGFALVKVEPR